MVWDQKHELNTRTFTYGAAFLTNILTRDQEYWTVGPESQGLAALNFHLLEGRPLPRFYLAAVEKNLGGGLGTRLGLYYPHVLQRTLSRQS